MVRRGPHLAPVVKADANARTVAVVTLTFGRPGARPAVASRLEVIDESVPAAPAVEAAAHKWTKIAFDGFRAEGFAPEAVVATTTEPLDGRESVVRNRPGRLTDIVAAGMAHEIKDADVAILNGGSIRIDDVVPPGPVTEYDIIRILPFGGRVAKADLDGDLLAQVLETGVDNAGLGGYLQVWGAGSGKDGWVIQNRPLDVTKRYRVALPEFLLTGAEVNLKYLTRDNPKVHDVEPFRDVRRTTIDELRAQYPSK
jgi:5'-nucleotidase